MKWSNTSIEDALNLNSFNVQGYVTGGASKRAPIALFDARYQGADADLAAIAELTTASFGRSLLTLADAAALSAAHTHTFASLTSKPTTLSGYGITDALAASMLDTDGTLAANSDAKIASQKAVKAFVDNRFTALVGAAPSALDTLGEIALALGNDASLAATITTALAAKLAISANLSDLSSAEAARGNLGLAIGAEVQAWGAPLDAFAALADASGVLTNNGAGGLSWLGTTAGGNGTSDAGKLPVMDGAGGLTAQGFVAATPDFGDFSATFLPTGVAITDSASNKATAFDAENLIWFANSGAARSTLNAGAISGADDFTATLPLSTGTLALTNQADGSIPFSILTGTAALSQLEQGGATSGQVLAWNGSAWTPTTASGGAVSDGDKGDVTVSDGGSVWTVDDNAITNAKLAGSISNAKLANSAITINGSAVSLGGSVTTATLGANTFTAAQLAQITAIGAATTAGHTLENTTAAANGAQQNSPAFLWSGRGWNGSASAAARYASYVTPIQGSGSITSRWNLDFDNGSGSFTQGLRYTPGYAPIFSLGGTGAFGGGILQVDYNNGVGMAFTAASFNFYSNGQTQTCASFGNAASGSSRPGLTLGTSANAGIHFVGSSSAHSGTVDLAVLRDGAGIFSQRVGTSAQALRIHNTWTSSTNFEAFACDWQTTANVCLLGTTQGSGGGSARALHLMTGGSAAIKIDTSGGVDLARLSTTAETITCDKTITLKIGGVSVKIPCL